MSNGREIPRLCFKNRSNAWQQNRITTTAILLIFTEYILIIIVRIERLRSEVESSAGKKQMFNVSIKVKFINSCVRS